METLYSLHRQGIETADAQPVMMRARAIKTADEIALLEHAAAMVDAVYEEIYRTRLPGRAVVLRTPVWARSRRRALRGADDLPRPLARPPDRDRGRHGVRPRDVLPRDRRRVCCTDRGGGRRHHDRLPRDNEVPGTR